MAQVPLSGTDVISRYYGYYKDFFTSIIRITGGPPLTRKSLTRFPLPRFLAYVRASGGFSGSRGL